MSKNNSKPTQGPPGTSMKKNAVVSFSVFLVFFVYYMGTAILQTPNFKHIASIPLFGIPSGLFLSLLIFPVSWLLIIIYFRIGR